LVKQALTLSPGRPDLTFILAQVYLRQRDLPAARETLEKVLRMSTAPHLRARAQVLLGSIATGK
ncbi:MAG TPA: tetratricopeptide repeat protein, partial [Pyrinomonadaceae bacterium]|nr:tetratricopeptide repeat protein [Pyrinomonadaceae bacterium]